MALIVGSDALLPPPKSWGDSARVFDAYVGGYGATAESRAISEADWDQLNGYRALLCQALSGLVPTDPPAIGADGVGRWRLNVAEIYGKREPNREEWQAIVLLNTLALVGQVAQGSSVAPAPPAQQMALGPAVAVVLVLVGLGAIAGATYAVSQYASVADRFLQREADLRQLRELDGHAIELTAQRMKFAADHPTLPNPVAKLQDEAIERLAALQAQLIANRPGLTGPPATLDPSKIVGAAAEGLFSSPWTWAAVAVGAVALYWTATDRG